MSPDTLAVDTPLSCRACSFLHSYATLKQTTTVHYPPRSNIKTKCSLETERRAPEPALTIFILVADYGRLAFG